MPFKASTRLYEYLCCSGIDEKTPSNAVIAREERRNKKRKKGEKVNPDEATNGGPSKPAPASAPKKTAVWVTNLPPNTTLSTLSSVFSKAGVLLIGEDGEPRIKMYYDDEGKFKGEALIMYFKEGSVDLAITLLDDSELEMGAGFGNMRVRVAEYDKGQGGTTNAKESGTKGEKEEKAEKEKRKPPTAEEKLRMTKRIRKMQEWVKREAEARILLIGQKAHMAFGFRLGRLWRADRRSTETRREQKQQGGSLEGDVHLGRLGERARVDVGAERGGEGRSAKLWGSDESDTIRREYRWSA